MSDEWNIYISTWKENVLKKSAKEPFDCVSGSWCHHSATLHSIVPWYYCNTTFNLNLICCADKCFDFVQGLGVKKKTKSKSIYTMCIILLLQSLCKLSYCFGCRLFAFNIRIYQNFKIVRFPLYLSIRMKPQRLV